MSINLFNAQIESLSVHKIGNKSRNEQYFLSDEPYKVSDELMPLLKEYFFKPFRDKEESYFRFSHDVHLDYHDMHQNAVRIFNAPNLSHLVSQEIAKHLHSVHNHPHIKNGELYVAYIKNVEIGGLKTDAIGIFKSEIKEDYLEINEPTVAWESLPNPKYLDLVLKQGVNLGKLDKGALIFNVQGDSGYKIMSIDSNKYDARYWLEHFLSVDIFEDEHFRTRKYMKFVQDFGKEVILPAEDKKAEVLFMNKAINHFAKNDEFEETKFLNEVLDNPDLIPEFKNYKVDKAAKYSIEDLTSFPISNPAVNDMRSKFKSLIKLDTGVEIKINITNPEAAEKVIERGWDEERQSFYYLIYGKEIK